ncbi:MULTISPECIES: hypothetical protein [unclassified Micromonospora]|uniref:hypothetical protein n=1 Tax=unclassified Micromonospora TaxID=2617518 RepID=UPI003644F2AC
MVGFALLQGEPIVPGEVHAALAGRVDGRAAWFVAHALIDRSELALAAELLPAGSRSAVLFAAIGDRWGRLQATDWVGGLAEMRGEHERAAALHREGLRWAEELSLWPEVGSKLAWLAVQTRDHGRARELAGRAYGLAVEQDAPAAMVFAETSLGIAARRAGELDVATGHLTRVAERGRRETRPALYLPMVLVELGFAAEQGGDPAAGLPLHLEAFDVAQAMGSPRDAAAALEGMASAAGPPEVASRLLGAAAAARLAAQAPAAPAERDETDRVTGRLVAALGRERFDALFAEGGRLGPGEARAQAGAAVTRPAPAGTRR